MPPGRPRKFKKSPAVILIEHHHRCAGNDMAWSRLEVEKLCALLNVTVFELGALYCVTRGQMRGYLRNNRFPLPLCLHFRMARNFYLERKMGTVHVPVVPVDFIL